MTTTHDRLHSIEVSLNRHLKAVKASYTGCQKQIRNTSLLFRPISTQDLTAVDTAIDRMRTISAKAVNQLHGPLTTQRIDAQEAVRLFKHVRQIDEPCFKPDLWSAAFKIKCAILAEGGLSGIMYSLGGNGDILGGLGYGLTFAATNITCGAISGFYFLRDWMNYRHINKNAKRIRALSASAFFGMTGLNVALIFSAARVRTTGDHGEILNFAEHSFLSTFNDGIALAIITLAVGGTILAINEGCRGISDRHSGYVEVTDYCHRKVDKPAEKYVLTTIANIEAVYYNQAGWLESRIDEIQENYIDRLSQLEELEDQLTDHESLVAAAADEIRRCDEAIRHIQQLTDETSINRDISRFALPVEDTIDTLKSEIDTHPEAPYVDALSRLSTAFNEAVNDIELAEMDFLNTSTHNAEDSSYV